jgi:virulence-associated protein VagC
MIQETSKEINLPAFPVRISEKNGKKLIFDPVRRKYVALTPEEWVRQHFVNYLITEKGYPSGLVANEVAIKLNHTNKRCDTVVYSRYLEPLAVIEYKSPAIEITNNVFDQIARYNMVLKVPFLIISNGLSHYCCRIDYNTQTYKFMEEIPDYTGLLIDN